MIFIRYSVRCESLIQTKDKRRMVSSLNRHVHGEHVERLEQKPKTRVKQHSGRWKARYLYSALGQRLPSRRRSTSLSFAFFWLSFGFGAVSSSLKSSPAVCTANAASASRHSLTHSVKGSRSNERMCSMNSAATVWASVGTQDTFTGIGSTSSLTRAGAACEAGAEATCSTGEADAVKVTAGAGAL